MSDGPEEEQDGGGRQEGTHGVHHARHLAGVAGKLREQVGREHEKWCPRRMAHSEFVAGVDKLRTVPERGCRFNRGAIDDGCNEERNPAHHIVH